MAGGDEFFGHTICPIDPVGLNRVQCETLCLKADANTSNGTQTQLGHFEVPVRIGFESTWIGLSDRLSSRRCGMDSVTKRIADGSGFPWISFLYIVYPLIYGNGYLRIS